MQERNSFGSFAHIHALIAEDDVLIAIDIEQTLVAKFGMKVSVAHTLRDGLAILDANPPHLAVLDYNLDGDGVEPLAKALVDSNVPIIFISGYASHALAPMAQGLTLEKPHSAEDLAGMVAQALARVAV
jgi:DNA-binding response OmpR family regulator